MELIKIRTLKDNKIQPQWKWVFFSFVCVLCMGLCLWLSFRYENLVNIISIVGSIASLAGIMVAIYQVWELKSRTKAIEASLNYAKEKLADITIFSDINTHSQIIKEIQVYIRSQKHEAALLTYRDFKEKLCKLLGYIEERAEMVDLYEELRRMVGNAGLDVNNLNRLVMQTSEKLFIDEAKMVENLEEIKTFLDKTSGKLSRENL